jgi:hypothetical protein
MQQKSAAAAKEEPNFDRIPFGEVVQAPPSIKVVPKKVLGTGSRRRFG